MSPIRASERARYPPDWPLISLRIRRERAGNRCECLGECGTDHRAELDDNPTAEAIDLDDPLLIELFGPDLNRCMAEQRRPHPVTGSLVILTVAHLDHTPEHCDDSNLRAMCQRCHLRYDADHHRETRAAAAEAARLASMTPLFDLPEGNR
jgi:hypothetical protein